MNDFLYKKLTFLVLFLSIMTEIMNSESVIKHYYKNGKEYTMNINKQYYYLEFGPGLTKLEGFEDALFVTDLSITDSPIDISQIINIAHLKSITLDNCNLDNLPVITNTNMEHLFIRNCNLSTISTKLDNLTNLQSLTIINTLINKIPELNHLKKLNSLMLVDNHIIEINSVNFPEGLREIDLRGNKITTISNLDKLNNILKLNIGNNLIAQVEVVENNSKLIYLNLSGNQIISIKGLEKLHNLKDIILNDNKLSNLKWLDLLPSDNLKIYISNNPINKQEILNYMKKGYTIYAE